MQTRCPHCQTRFRVTTEQLKLRQGQVRCGACHEVFDALDSLSDEALVFVPPPEAHVLPEATPDIPESQPLPDGTFASQAVPVPVEPVISVAAIEAAANETVALEPEPEPASAAEPVIAVEPEPTPETPVPVESETAETGVTENEITETETPELSALAEEWQPVPAVKPVRRWPWVIGSVILLLTAAAQLAYLFRVELAVVAPVTRPVLVAGCELLGCDLPRPRKPDQIDFETSDLAPQGTGLLLTATLRNRVAALPGVASVEAV